jgi:hypothetical protein
MEIVGSMGATFGAMLHLGAALSIDNGRHAGLHDIVPIEVGLPNISWSWVRSAKSMKATKDTKKIFIPGARERQGAPQFYRVGCRGQGYHPAIAALWYSFAWSLTSRLSGH